MYARVCTTYMYVCLIMHMCAHHSCDTTKNTHAHTRASGCVNMCDHTHCKQNKNKSIDRLCLYQSNTRAQVVAMHCDTMFNRQCAHSREFGARIPDSANDATIQMNPSKLGSDWNFHEIPIGPENLIIFMWAKVQA